MRRILSAAVPAIFVLATGCASDPGTKTEAAREAPVYRTGSIIPKRDRDPADTQVLDPQAVRDGQIGKSSTQPYRP